MKETNCFRNVPGYRQLFEKWTTMSTNLSTAPHACNLIGNLLLVVHPEADTGSIAAEMESALRELQLFSFSGKPGYISHSYKFCSEEAAAELELVRLWDHINDAARFKEVFRGILLLDITSWLNCTDNLYFVQMTELLASMSNDIITVFTVTNPSGLQLAGLQKSMACRISVDVLHLAAYDAQTLAICLREQFRSYGVDILPDALERLGKYCLQQGRSGTCEYTQSINSMALELSRITLQKHRKSTELAVEDVVAYIEQRNKLYEPQKRTIGFGR